MDLLKGGMVVGLLFPAYPDVFTSRQNLCSPAMRG